MAADTGQSLGEFLRHEREKRGITIEQVASATKIAVRILHSLEADQYSELPAKPFVRGFVISYVRFIGLDGKEVLTQFNDFIEQKAHDRPARDQGHSGYAFESRQTEQSRLILWGVMVGFLVIGGILLVVLKPSFHRSRGHKEKLARVASSPSSSPSVAALGALPSPSPSPAPAPAPSPSVAPAGAKAAAEKTAANAQLGPIPVASPIPSPSPSFTTSPNDPLNSGADLKKEDIRYRVVFRAVEDVWVRFQSDNRKPSRFILRKDKILIVRARDMIRFQASDPKSVRFSTANQPGRLVSEEKDAVMRQKDLTLFFPPEAANIVQDPFPGARPIHMVPVPPGPRPTASSSPTP